MNLPSRQRELARILRLSWVACILGVTACGSGGSSDSASGTVTKHTLSGTVTELGECPIPNDAISTHCEGDRTPVSGLCIRSALDKCESDSDCQVGGCGGELCYNPDQSDGFTTCDCGPPKDVSCGCVTGKCTWWQ